MPELVERFMALFAGLDRAHGVYTVAKKQDEGEKVKGKARTDVLPVTRELWQQHLDGEQGIGIVPIMDDGNVWWGVIDVDTYPLDHAAMEQKLNELKLPLVVVRSKSGGAHLFLFCAEPLPAKVVRAKLHEWEIVLGYPGAEVFPKQDQLRGTTDIGNWLNMPYFAVEQTVRYGYYKGEPLKAADFLDFAESRRVSRAALSAFIVASDELFNDAPPCLQHLIKAGFPKGTRNRGLFNLGVFARLAFDDEWQERLDGFNRAYMSPALSTGEVLSTCKSLTRKEYFYTCTQDPIASVCNKEICRTRKYGIAQSADSVPPMNLGHVQAIKSNPPVFLVEVEGVEIQCTAEDLLSQMRFRKLVLEQALKIFGTVKEPIWIQMVRAKLDNVEVLTAPEDAGPEGQFTAHLEAFCTSRVTANSFDELLLGKPYVDADAGRTFLRSTDLIRYLEQQKFRDFNERQIWATLRKIGGDHVQRTIKGKCITAWSIPSFNKQTEDFDPPPSVSGDDL